MGALQTLRAPVFVQTSHPDHSTLLTFGYGKSSCVQTSKSLTTAPNTVQGKQRDRETNQRLLRSLSLCFSATALSCITRGVHEERAKHPQTGPALMVSGDHIQDREKSHHDSSEFSPSFLPCSAVFINRLITEPGRL